MKKELLLAAALIFAAGTVTAEDTAKKAAVENVKPEYLKITEDLSTDNGKLPTNWVHNHNQKYLPGTCKMVKTEDGKYVVQLTGGAEKGLAHLIYAKRVKAKDGEKIEFTVKAKGSGQAGIGIYMYPEDGTWKWNGGKYIYFPVDEKFKEFKKVVTVKGNPMPAGQVALVIAAAPKSTIMFTEVKARKLSEKK